MDMDIEIVKKAVKEEFEEEWSGYSIERLLETNQYPRSREAFGFYEHLLPKNDLILEAGCGLGTKMMYFLDKGYRLAGVDYVLSALERLKAFRPPAVLSGADINHLPFKDGVFGAYLSYGVLEHFPQGPGAALKEAHRVLKPGGWIVMGLPAENFLSRFVYDENNFLHRLRCNPGVRRLFRKPGLPPREEAPTYFKLHTREEAREILTRTGFEVVLEKPISHGFNLYLCCECFHADSFGKTNSLADRLARLLKTFFPWSTCNHLLMAGRKR